jgi:hypothetical protein
VGTKLLIEEFEVDKTENTLDIMHSYINGINHKDIDIDKLKIKMQDLYEQALLVETV